MQLLYESTRLRSARSRFRDWSVSPNHIADPRSYKIQRQYAIFQAWCLCLKVFLAPTVFVLFESILSRSFCVHLHNLHKRIQTFEGCILNVWKYIYNEAIQVRNYDNIALLSLEWGGGGGVGENDKRSYLNRKCRTIWSTLSIHDHSPWPVSINFWKLGKESSIAFVKYIS